MRNMWAKWGLIYPVHFVRGEWVPFYRLEIQEIDSLTHDDMLCFQENKLAHLLQHCYRHDPYYQRVLEKYAGRYNFERPLSFFDQLPFLTKDIVRQQTTERRHSLWQRLDYRSTSGSTGSPITFFKDRFATAYMEAVQNYAFSWHSVSVGEPQGRFWGLPTGKKKAVARFKDLLKNRIRFSAFDLSDEAKYTFYKRLLRFRPTYFYGYPSLILDFARFLKRENLSLQGVPLKTVIGTGEYVYPHEKEELELLLRVNFVSEYGCSEIGVIGFDCPHGNMHVMASNILIEIIDSKGCLLAEGEEGEIVITELNARYFPFIRYRLGDRGRMTGEKCLCGRTSPLLQINAGRKDDYIITPEGHRVYDAILAYTLKRGVVQFKAVQDRIDRLRIFIVPDLQYNDSLEQEYALQLRQLLSPAMSIEFLRVTEIERDISGKLRYFRSEIGSGER